MIIVQRVTEMPGKHGFYFHQHSNVEIDLFETGKGSYLIDDLEYDFEQGDIFLFANNQVHMVNYVDPAAPMNTLKMYFEPRFLWDNSVDKLNSNFLKVFFERRNSAGVLLKRQTPVAQKVRELMLDIERESQEKQYESENIIKLNLIHILILVIRHFQYYDEESDDIAFQMKNYKPIKKVLSYIDDNYCENISLEDLANISNMSKNNMIHIFKKLNGVSPYHYIILKRIEHAVRLLTETDCSVTEIIYTCGFNNPVSFYKLMKKYSGKTPLDIRKQRMEEQAGEGKK